MMNFDERDLVAHCEAAGFVDIHLRLHILVRPRVPTKWDVVMDAPGNPEYPKPPGGHCAALHGGGSRAVQGARPAGP